MNNGERTDGKKNCLSVKFIDGKPVFVERCARMDECRQRIEMGKHDKWECPGYVAEEKAQAPDVGRAEGGQENA